jgi:dynein intermediate chain 2
MNEYEYLYVKKRKEFGRHCGFEDAATECLVTQTYNMGKEGEKDQKRPEDMYVEQTIINITLDNIPSFSEHAVNTAQVEKKSHQMYHHEGGWPREIEPDEAQDTLKWRKRTEKDPAFISVVKQLTKATVMCLEQNSTIDLFEHYFHQEEPDHLPENLSMKTVALFKDPADEKRSVTKIGWHPEGPTKLVGSYSNLRFQRMTDEMPMASFIWDISERNVPLTELRSATPLVCCQYNQRNSDWMVGGCYNGLLNYYDLRKGPTPVLKSAVEVSHWDPVYDVVWMQSKTNRDCASVSSDGRLLFWDVAMMNQTIDSCVLTDGAKEEPKNVGGVSLEWMQEAGPTKFLVGTEHGVTLSCSRKPKKAVEIGTWFGQEDRGGYGRHFGPVYSVKRNPFHTKFFLTVGDWCTKMWMEELKGPLLQTPYYPSFLSAASWSPTRPGVFFLCRADGRLDTWDYFYRMNEVSLSQKVTDSALTSLSVQNGGQFAAVGDSEGVITLLQLCDGLVQPMPNEKNMIGQLFEREQKREKNLEQIKRQGATQKGHKEDRDRSSISIDQNEYQQREKTFFHEVGMTGEELGTTPLKPGGAART